MSAPSSAAAPDILRLNREAVAAMAARKLDQAEALISEALLLDSKFLKSWINFAVIRRMKGDLPAAMQALEMVRSIDPLYFPALLMRGSLYEAMDAPRHAALSYKIALAQMLPEDLIDPPTQRAVAHAKDYVAAYHREMESFLLAESGDFLAGDSAPVQRMRGFLDHSLGKARPFPSKPTNFYYPGLPLLALHDRDSFPWLADLEAATPKIQAELAALFEDQEAAAGIEPQMQRAKTEPIENWGELNHSTRWTAYHFCNRGHLQDRHRRQCPQTAALLDRMPQPFVANFFPLALFSILQPQTHVPAHHGLANFRLLCHLPLILPGDCALRVGDIVKPWKMGEAFVFDDTIEHEAWNRSDRQRVILLFDIWHPYLHEDERAFISRTIAAIDHFNGQP